MRKTTWIELEMQREFERRVVRLLELAMCDAENDARYWKHHNEEERRFEEAVNKEVDRQMKQINDEINKLAQDLRDAREPLENLINSFNDSQS